MMINPTITQEERQGTAPTPTTPDGATSGAARILTPNQIEAAKDWILDCDDVESREELDTYTPRQIENHIKLVHAGGIEAFALANPDEATAPTETPAIIIVEPVAFSAYQTDAARDWLWCSELETVQSVVSIYKRRPELDVIPRFVIESLIKRHYVGGIAAFINKVAEYPIAQVEAAIYGTLPQGVYFDFEGVDIDFSGKIGTFQPADENDPEIDYYWSYGINTDAEPMAPYYQLRFSEGMQRSEDESEAPDGKLPEPYRTQGINAIQQFDLFIRDLLETNGIELAPLTMEVRPVQTDFSCGVGISPDQIQQARLWIVENDEEVSSLHQISELTDAQIIAHIARTYEGGLIAFIQSTQAAKTEVVFIATDHQKETGATVYRSECGNFKVVYDQYFGLCLWSEIPEYQCYLGVFGGIPPITRAAQTFLNADPDKRHYFAVAKLDSN